MANSYSKSMPYTTQLPPSVAQQSLYDYGTLLGKFADFLAGTTRDQIDDAQAWCRYVLPVFSAFETATRQVQVNLVTLGVVGGACLADASRAAGMTYYLARVAFTTIPHTAEHITTPSAENINALRGRDVATMFAGLEPFGFVDEFWSSWVDASANPARLTNALIGAVDEWTKSLRAAHLGISERAIENGPVDTWSLYHLAHLAQALATITTGLNAAIRFATELGLKQAEVARIAKIGSKGLLSRVKSAESLSSEGPAPSPDYVPPSSSEKTFVLCFEDGKVVGRHGLRELARADTYLDAIRSLFRYRRTGRDIEVLEVRDGVVPVEMAPIFMERYGLRSVRFEPRQDPLSIAS